MVRRFAVVAAVSLALALPGAAAAEEGELLPADAPAGEAAAREAPAPAPDDGGKKDDNGGKKKNKKKKKGPKAGKGAGGKAKTKE